ncbi:MAG: NifB/NifX family molybdenum-iron cluster-binding protein [Terracidiphilus sp.]
MRIAIPQWQGRVSPVFDVAGNLLLIDIENGREIRREERRLLGTNPSTRMTEFLSFGAGILICGAISAPLQSGLNAAGVQVIAFACGMVDDVLAAYLNGTLRSRVFVMPGCQRWRRRGSALHCSGGIPAEPLPSEKGENKMPGGFGIGAGRGGGRRARVRGQGAGGAERTGGPAVAGPGGFCVCAKCGEKVAHAAGQPCLQMLCPKCGQPMTRGQ